MRIRNVDVLVVEDQPVFAELTLRALQAEASSIRTALATTGAAAIQYLQTHDPKAILLDINLPDSDGIRVLKSIRDNPRTHSIPVIILTGSPLDRQRRDVHVLGISGYIVKSADIRSLGEHLSIFRYLMGSADDPKLHS